jgi:hypothetical protein
MCSISLLFICGNIAENEYIEPRKTRNLGLDRCNGEEDRPRKEPDREEDADTEAEEANEKVCVNSISGNDVAVIGVVDSERPSEQ